MTDTTLTTESEEELTSLFMKVKEESEKASLKLNIQKTKIMASGPITSWQIDRQTMEAVTVYFLGLQNHCRSWLQKRHLLLGRKAMTNLVQLLSHVWLFATPQHARPPSPSPTPGVHPNPHPLSQWCHPTISSSVIPFSSCPWSFPASGSLQMRQLFASGGQSIGVSASTSVFPMNTQNWSPLGWTGWISLQSKGLSRVFSNTTVQKHQFFGTQLSL